MILVRRGFPSDAYCQSEAGRSAHHRPRQFWMTPHPVGRVTDSKSCSLLKHRYSCRGTLSGVVLPAQSLNLFVGMAKENQRTRCRHQSHGWDILMEQPNITPYLVADGSTAPLNSGFREAPAQCRQLPQEALGSGPRCQIPLCRV